MAVHINANTSIEKTFFDDDDIQIIRLAGMLHDIGHYPMSHNVEHAYRDASDSMKKKRGTKETPTQKLKEITKCPDFLNPMAEPEESIPYDLHGLSAEDLEELRTKVKNKRLKFETDYFDKFTGSTGHHHENIGNLIIISNKSIHDTVKEHFILLEEDGKNLSRDIFVLVDESHRSNYGLMATKMRLVFPNACYIGFTGTPLMRGQHSTVGKFGEYIHRYTIKDGVDDGAIVPLIYEGRFVDQRVDEENIDLWFLVLGSSIRRNV